MFLYLEKHSFRCSECDFPEANELELDSKEKQSDVFPTSQAWTPTWVSHQECGGLFSEVPGAISDNPAGIFWPAVCYVGHIQVMLLGCPQAPSLTWADRFSEAIAVSRVQSEQAGLLWGRLTTAVCCWMCHWSSSSLSLLMYTIGIVIMFTARTSGR